MASLKQTFKTKSITLGQWLYFLRGRVTLPEQFHLDGPSFVEKSLLYPELGMEASRHKELGEFFGLSQEEAATLRSGYDKSALEDHFQDVATDQGLLSNYRSATQDYIARLMLRYNHQGVERNLSLIHYINPFYPPEKRGETVVLDYGCGASDLGLGFALHGYKLRICDIEGGNLDFAKWRYQRRNIPCDVLPVNENNLYPDLGRNDIIMAGEVLEHVREPLTVLKNIERSLPSGGFLWLSAYPMRDPGVANDHLEEARAVRLEAMDFVNTRFKRAHFFPLPLGKLFRKK